MFGLDSTGVNFSHAQHVQELGHLTSGAGRGGARLDERGRPGRGEADWGGAGPGEAGRGGTEAGWSIASRARPLDFDPPIGKQPSWMILRKHAHINCRTQKPDIPRAGRAGAAHGGAAGRGGAGQDGPPKGRFAQETTDPLAPQGIGDNCPGRRFGSMDKRNIIYCRIRNPDIPRAGRVGAAHGGAAGRGRAGRDADRTVHPGDNRPLHPQRHRRHIS